MGTLKWRSKLAYICMPIYYTFMCIVCMNMYSVLLSWITLSFDEALERILLFDDNPR